MVLMILFRGASIPNSWPAIFLKAHNTLVVADLHIGYESALRRKGLHLPQASYSYMKRHWSRCSRRPAQGASSSWGT
jgi:metallophosphoesterase superfamily enzyme